jgi:hypothetical protein
MIAVRHRAALLPAVLTVVAAVLALPSPAHAVVRGFDVKLTQVPATFVAGQGAQSVTAVVSTDTAPRCQKVRWSMLLRVLDGVTLDDVKVTRIEDGGEFPVRAQVDGDTARLTDTQFDPGELCRGRTVTARYAVAFDGDAPQGRVAFEVQAFTATNLLLQQASTISRVAGTTGPEPTGAATPSPSPTGSDDAGAGAGDDASAEPSDSAAAPAATATATEGISANAAAANGGVPSLLGPGLIVGALFVFAGMGILLRLRSRARAPKTRPMPTSFYPAP